jgi:hypothetical protein
VARIEYLEAVEKGGETGVREGGAEREVLVSPNGTPKASNTGGSSSSSVSPWDKHGARIILEHKYLENRGD